MDVCDVLYEMALNEEYAEILYEEVMKAHPMSKPILYEDLNKCDYLDMFLKESLRRHTAVNRIFRVAMVDFQFENGIKVKKGDFVAIPLHVLHNSSEIYPDPYSFIPERFEKSNNIQTCAWIPFSEGSRHCIGQRISMVQLKLTLIHFIREFRITCCPQTKPPKYMNSQVLMLYKKLELCFHKREH